MRSHGYIATYVNDRCRCDDCRAASAAKRRQKLREQRAGRPTPDNARNCVFCGETFHPKGIGRHERSCARATA